MSLDRFFIPKNIWTFWESSCVSSRALDCCVNASVLRLCASYLPSPNHDDDDEKGEVGMREGKQRRGMKNILTFLESSFRKAEERDEEMERGRGGQEQRKKKRREYGRTKRGNKETIERVSADLRMVMTSAI